jgi:hypothetical protein
MTTFTHASHADALVKRHGFPDGTVRLLCGVARATGWAKSTLTDDPCGMQLLVCWFPVQKVFACEVIDGRRRVCDQLERFNVR